MDSFTSLEQSFRYKLSVRAAWAVAAISLKLTMRPMPVLGAAALEPGEAIDPPCAVVDCASSSLLSGRSGLKVSLVSSKCPRFRRSCRPFSVVRS